LSLATLSGCDVVLTDLPVSGLRIARARAAQDGLGNRCSVLAASGATLPFADRGFDRIHHADVLCCLEPKREVLRECRRVARAGAPMEFSVISLAREPSGDEERQLLERSGPPYPEVEMDYPALLSIVGWSVLERIDVTSEFARGMGVLLERMHARREALLALLGERDYAERMEHRQSGHAAISRGLLKREIFLAR
jgi:SAM-dependent methyltransferase